MKFTTSIIFSISCLLACNQTLADKLYKWKDARGVTHFSEHPPMNLKAEVIKPKTGHSDPVTYATASSSNNASSKASTGDTKVAFVDPERCAAARKNQEILTTSSRIKVMGDNGEYRYLTPDEQKQKNDEASTAIKESCE